MVFTFIAVAKLHMRNINKCYINPKIGMITEKMKHYLFKLVITKCVLSNS